MNGHVRKRGDKWYYSFELARVDGKRKRIERVGGSTKKEALKSMRVAMLEYESAGKVTFDSSISVADFYKFWMESYAILNLKYNTAHTYETLIQNHIIPKIGNYKLSSISPANLQEMINDIYRSGKSKSTLDLIFAILSKSFKMAVHPYQLIKENPVPYIIKPKFESKREDLKIITRADFRELLDLFPESHYFHIVLQIGFHTGMRLGEILGLRWDCVDLRNQKINIEKTLIQKPKGVYEFGSPKTASSIRTISINSQLTNILAAHQKWQKEDMMKYGPHYSHNNLVCEKNGGKFIKRTDITRYVNMARNKLDLDFSFHSLRHTHASLLIEAGVNFKAIQKRLGHANLTTTMNVYAHLTEKLEDQTKNALEQLI